MNKFENLKRALNLKANPVGVKLIYEHNNKIDNYIRFKEGNRLERYCESVKRASEEEFLKIDKGHLSCKTAKVMLGFKDSDNLELTMRLDMKGLQNILLFPHQ